MENTKNTKFIRFFALVNTITNAQKPRKTRFFVGVRLFFIEQTKNIAFCDFWALVIV